MRTVLQPCISTLLLSKHASLQDLQSMMTKSVNNRRIEMGKHSRIPSHKAFFQNEFTNGMYDFTKNSLFTKLQSLLNSPTFYNWVTGIDTINLDRCIRTGKVVLFNLSKGKYGEEVSATLGRFIIAKLKTIALQRSGLPDYLRKPIYLVIDEADGFLGGKSLNVILKEARKYGLHLVLSTQNLINGKDQSELKRNVLSNTHVKVIGMNGLTSLTPLGKETTIPLPLLQKLYTFQFWVSIGKKRPFKLTLRNALGSGSPLIRSRKGRSLNSRIIKHTPYYKPVLTTHSNPYERIEEYPFDMQNDALQEAMPRPFYSI